MNELAKKLVCVQMRSGVEIWLEEEKAVDLQQILKNLRNHMFIKHADQTINTADIVGVFTAATMEENTRRKNGQWKCTSGNWHDRGDKCQCVPAALKQMIQSRDEAIKNCKLGCKAGYVLKDNTAQICECIKPFVGKTMPTV